MASCPYCNLDVSPSADTCPKCGHSFLRDQAKDFAWRLFEGGSNAAWSFYMFVFHAALVFGIFFGFAKMIELENNPFGGGIDSGEQQSMWFFFLVLPCSLLLVYQVYAAIKDRLKK